MTVTVASAASPSYPSTPSRCFPLNKVKVEKVCVRHKAELSDSQGDENLNGLPREMSGSPSERFRKKRRHLSPKACGCQLEGRGLDSAVLNFLPVPLSPAGREGRPERNRWLELSVVLKRGM